MILPSELKYYHANNVVNTDANGGPRGTLEFVHGVCQNVFPFVDATERAAGLTRYRQRYLWNKNAANENAQNNKAFFSIPSQADDRYAMCLGIPSETQGQMKARTKPWVGPFQLQTAITGGPSQIIVTTEGADIQFINGGLVKITDSYKVSETIAPGVVIGDSVQWNTTASQWETVTATEDITYPKGRYLGGGTVETFTTGTSHVDYLVLPENLYEDENIGTGDGSSTTPELTTLTNNANGIVDFDADMLPVITATCGGTARTVTVAADGSCTGYCSAGTLNMVTGVWDTDIVWNSAPDNATSILATYREKCYSYSGNVATIALASQVPNAYATANTFGSGILKQASIRPYIENWTETSAAGAYDESGYPLAMYNLGAEHDHITITFITATTFTCTGTRFGSLGAGSIAANFEPINSATGVTMFSIYAAGWGGTHAAGDTYEFDLFGSEMCTWLRQLLPAGMAAVAENQFSTTHVWE